MSDLSVSALDSSSSPAPESFKSPTPQETKLPKPVPEQNSKRSSRHPQNEEASMTLRAASQVSASSTSEDSRAEEWLSPSHSPGTLPRPPEQEKPQLAQQVPRCSHSPGQLPGCQKPCTTQEQPRSSYPRHCSCCGAVYSTVHSSGHSSPPVQPGQAQQVLPCSPQPGERRGLLAATTPHIHRLTGTHTLVPSSGRSIKEE